MIYENSQKSPISQNTYGGLSLKIEAFSAADLFIGGLPSEIEAIQRRASLIVVSPPAQLSPLANPRT
jgi:hypothetical protein